MQTSIWQQDPACIIFLNPNIPLLQPQYPLLQGFTHQQHLSKAEGMREHAACMRALPTTHCGAATAYTRLCQPIHTANTELCQPIHSMKPVCHVLVVAPQLEHC